MSTDFLPDSRLRRAVLDILRASVVLMVLFTVLLGVIYPLIVTGIAKVVFPHQASGYIIINDKDTPVGSQLIGQGFTRKEYFWSRPSATTPPYNAALSSASNLGPFNPVYAQRIAAQVEALKAAHEGAQEIPVELITTSASGLDPHISVPAAVYQINRVAKARNIKEDEVEKLVTRMTEPPQLGILGPPRINVLLLNMALDAGTDFKEQEPDRP